MTTTAVPPRDDEHRRGLALPLEQQVRRWRRLLEALARRHGLDADDVDDVEQDVRIRLWRLAERQGGVLEAAASYAYQAVQSAVLDLLRRRRTRERAQVPLAVAGEPVAAPDGPTVEAVESALVRALASLEPARRVVVRLHLQGQERAEIQRLLGWSEARVRNLLYRGLDDLKAALRQEAT